jgi:nucleotidyltransferase substrate binding protein (TIGR01987 family)
MASKNIKLIKSLDALKEALSNIESVNVDKENLAFLSLAKAFEVAVEYGWKQLQTIVEGEGLEAPSPKASIRESARLGLIDDAKAWIDYINTRNASVHDYFGMSQDEYIQIAKDFLSDARKAFKA